MILTKAGELNYTVFSQLPLTTGMVINRPANELITTVSLLHEGHYWSFSCFGFHPLLRFRADRPKPCGTNLTWYMKF